MTASTRTLCTGSGQPANDVRSVGMDSLGVSIRAGFCTRGQSWYLVRDRVLIDHARPTSVSET